MANNKAFTKIDLDQLSLLQEQLPPDSQIFFKYQGPFDKDKIRWLSNKISQLTDNDVQAYKKLFYVFIELAQNVNNYSDWRENGTGVGGLILAQTQQNYLMIIGNVVNNNDLQVLIKKCDIINSLDRDSLRLFKRQQRNLIPGTNQNAHIGLIMVALTTRRKLDIVIKPIDHDFSFFILRIVIPKSAIANESEQ